MLRIAHLWGPGIVCVCGLFLATACIPIDLDSGSTTPDQVLGSDPTETTDPEPNLEAEPNDQFAGAQPVYVDGQVELIGTLQAHAEWLDQDIWDLGPADVGDRVVCKITAEQYGNLVVGILDDGYNLFGRADASNATTYARTLDVVVRQRTEHLYVIFTSVRDNDTSIDYSAVVRIDRTQAAPPAQPQVVILDFTGASQVKIASRSAVNVPPFDATVISETFADQTDLIIEYVVEMVREDFGDLGVSIYLDTDPDRPTENASTIYFGTYSASLLGLADNVDVFNGDTTQSAIIYTDTFDLFVNLRPDAREIAQVLANVTSHEIGHLLGLRHTADPRSVMDISATASQMLRDQWFDTFDIHESVFTAGYQDAPAMLSWAVGGEVTPPSATKLMARQKAAPAIDPSEDYHIPHHWLTTSECSLHDEHP